MNTYDSATARSGIVPNPLPPADGGIVCQSSQPSFKEGAIPLPQTLLRSANEEVITPYPEDNDFPPIRPSFYPDSNTVWVRNNTPDSTFVRDYRILFDLNNDFPKNKELVIDTLELVLFATGDDSNLTIDLYLDNKLKASIPYGQYYRTVLDLKALGLSEQDRTLSYRKNIMVKFNQNGELYTKMGVCFTSEGVPSGHIKGRLIDKIRPLPLKTCTYLTDHNKNVTGLADEEGNLVATWDYDAFGNIIRQTGPMASSNPLRFSSEYHDDDLGLIYYNYRHYNPRDGRWISRDSIEETSGINLYAFIHNLHLGIDSLGLEYRPCSNGVGVRPEAYNSFDVIGKRQKEWRKMQCEQKRKEKMKELNNLLSSQNSEEPDCSESPTCKMVSLVIEVSDPCQEAIIQYGHAGIAVDNKFYDSGPNIFWQNAPYWSKKNPTLPQADQHAKIVAKAPVLKVKFCACKKEYLAIQLKWHLMNIFRTSAPAGNIWGFSGTCSSDVARVLGSSNNPFISPDDILTDIAPSLVNSCGSQRGKSAYIEMIHNPWPIK